MAYGAGLRAREVVGLKVADVDGERKILRIDQGKGRKDRYAMLSPSRIVPWARATRHQVRRRSSSTGESMA